MNWIWQERLALERGVVWDVGCLLCDEWDTVEDFVFAEIFRWTHSLCDGQEIDIVTGEIVV